MPINNAIEKEYADACVKHSTVILLKNNCCC